MRFFTSDLHFGHINVVKWRGCFDSVEHMNTTLIERWNSVVGPDDTVDIVGDAVMGHKAETLPLIGQLNGTKILRTGNHDAPWEGNKPKYRDKWTPQYLEAGFAEIIQGTQKITVGGIPVLIGHFPYHGDHTEEERYKEYRPEDRGGVLVHGHVHSMWRIREKMINVGVDVNNFTPISEDELVETIKKEM